MESSSASAWLNANIGQLWIPLLVAIGAVTARALIHWYAARRLKRSGTELESRLVMSAESSFTPLLMLIALYLICFALPLKPEVIRGLQQALAILAIAVAIGALSRILAVVGELWRSSRPAMERYVQPLRTMLTGVLILAGIALALRILEMDLTGEGKRLIRIAGILLGGYFLIKVVQIAIAKLESMVGHRDKVTAAESSRRARTLGRVLNNMAWAIVISVGVTMTLSEFGMDIMPIVTGWGIAGLAVGFGAQNLVRDVIGGFFLILENQVRVGDVAVINGTGGSVEAINLRTIVLRDVRGAVHIFPNGGISQVSNMTKEWSRCVIDLALAYEEDVDRAMSVLAEVGAELYEDAAYRPVILEKPEVLGVEDLGEFQITIRVAVKTLPLKQWIVGRELRRRIKIRFDREGIKAFSPGADPARQKNVRLSYVEPAGDNNSTAD